MTRTLTLAIVAVALVGCSSSGSDSTTSSGITSGAASSGGASGGGTTGGTTAGTSGGAASTSSSSSSGSGSSSGGTTGGVLVDGGFGCGGDADGGADTWRNYAQCFFSAYCVSCHPNGGGGASAQDFSQYTQVQTYAPIIRCGVSVQQDSSWACSTLSFPTEAEQFPVGNGPKPQASDRDRLVAWIDAGLPF